MAAGSTSRRRRRSGSWPRPSGSCRRQGRPARAVLRDRPDPGDRVGARPAHRPRRDPAPAAVPRLAHGLESVGHLRRYVEYFDEETADLLSAGGTPLDYPNQFVTNDVQDSKAIERAPRPYMIVASNGMLTGGRVVAHLRNLIDDPTATIFRRLPGQGHPRGAPAGRRDERQGRRPAARRSLSGSFDQRLLRARRRVGAARLARRIRRASAPATRAFRGGSSWCTATPRRRSHSSQRCRRSASRRMSRAGTNGLPSNPDTAFGPLDGLVRVRYTYVDAPSSTVRGERPASHRGEGGPP